MRRLAILTFAVAALATPALAWIHGSAALPITPPGAPSLTCADFQRVPGDKWAPIKDVIVGAKAPGVEIRAGKHFDDKTDFDGVRVGEVLDQRCPPPPARP